MDWLQSQDVIESPTLEEVQLAMLRLVKEEQVIVARFDSEETEIS